MHIFAKKKNKENTYVTQIYYVILPTFNRLPHTVNILDTVCPYFALRPIYYL